MLLIDRLRWSLTETVNLVERDSTCGALLVARHPILAIKGTSTLVASKAGLISDHSV